MELIEREDAILKAARDLGMGGFAVAKLREKVAEQLRGAWSDGNRYALGMVKPTETE